MAPHTFHEVAQRTTPNLPYYAWAGPHPPTGRYRPDYVELFLVTSGEGLRTMTARDGTTRTTRMTPGRLYLYRPMDVLELGRIGPDGYSVICVAFPFPTWERFAMLTEVDQRLFTRPTPPEVEIDPEDPAAMAPFRRILERYRERPDAMDLVQFLTVTVPWFVDAAGDEEKDGAPPWLWAAVSAMYDEANLRAGVARFAELCHVSHTHLWRNTRAYFGLSPSDLVAEIRVRHAALLLVATDDPVGEIAERCGFSSASHFSKAFRRDRGTSPRDYRLRSRASVGASDSFITE